MTEHTHDHACALLTPAELAKRWKISAGTLANQRSLGRGPSYRRIGTLVRYCMADVLAYEVAVPTVAA